MTQLHRSTLGLGRAPQAPASASASASASAQPAASWMDWGLGRRIAVAAVLAAGLWTSVAWALAATP